jgi:hypothetical protein
MPFDIKSGAGYTMVCKPNEQIGVVVSMDPGLAETGFVHKTVWLFAKGQATPAASLIVEGTILPVPQFSDDVVAFGDVPANSQLTRLETVSVNTSTLPAGSTWSLVSSNPDVTVAPLPSAPNAPTPGLGMETRSYKVTLPSSAHLGTITGNLSVVFSLPGHPDTVSGFMPVVGSVTGDIHGLPDTLPFGNVFFGQSSMRQAFIR